MKLKHDHMLAQLCHFGFRCEEKTADGFLRYSRRIGDLLITVANGQFENKIRLSMLEDKEGHIRTSYHDLHAYTDLIGALAQAGMLLEESYVLHHHEEDHATVYDMHENQLIAFPKKPEGFMI